MDKQLNQTNTESEVSVEPALVTKLSKELLFTLKHLEKQAKELRDEPFVINKHRPMLDEMVEEAQRMDRLLQDLKIALRNLKSDLT